MDRRVKPARLLAAAGILAAALALISCPGSLDLLDAVTTEVMVANDKFLVVDSVEPLNNAQAVNPGNRILIVFDRALDESTITPANIVIANDAGDPPVDWVWSFNGSTHTLTVQPDPYLEGPETYNVTIGSGLRGADDSRLQQAYAWTFETRLYPGGSVFFQQEPYTLSTSVNFTININPLVNQYRWVLVNEGVDADTAFDNPGTYTQREDWANTPTTGVDSSFSRSGTLPSGEGSKIVHLQVREFDAGIGTNNTAEAVDDQTFYDSTAPSVSITTWPTAVRAVDAASQSLVATASDTAAGSGIASRAWTAPRISGLVGSLSFANASVLSTSVSDPAGTADGTFQLTLTVTDNAGRTSIATRDVQWDRIYPGVTVSGSTYTVDPTKPTWSWSSSADDLPASPYSRSLDGGGAVPVSTTSYTPTSLSYGPHTLSVTATDDNDNLSSASRTIYYSPGNIRPYWGQTRVPTGDPDLGFLWPAYSGIYTYQYALFLYPGTRPPSNLTPLKSGLTNNYYVFTSRDADLSAYTQYSWYYQVYHNTKLGPILDHTSPTYTFLTGR